MAVGWVQRVVDAGELCASVMNVVEGVCRVQVSCDVQVAISLVVVAVALVWDLFAQGASDGGARDS